MKQPAAMPSALSTACIPGSMPARSMPIPAGTQLQPALSSLQALVAEMVGNFSKRLEPYGVKVG